MIVNPRAGRGLTGEDRAALVARLRARWPSLRACISSSPSDAEARAREAAIEGVSTLIALGGDGTLNAIVNGVAAVPGGLERTTFGVLPGGTGNDLAGTLGLRARVVDAADRLLDGDPITIDLGLLDDRVFTNVSAGGFFAEASEAATRDVKSVAGRLAYVVAGSRALLDHEPFALELDALTSDGPLRWSGDVSMFAVCNGPTAGGGEPIAPFARIDDGWLDAFFVHEGTRLDLARVLVEISGARHFDDDRVVGFRASELTIRFARPTPVNVDGEVALRERARYRILPRATRILATPLATATDQADAATPASPAAP